MYRGANVADVDSIDPDHKEESRRRGTVLHILDGILNLGLGSLFGLPVSCLWRARFQWPLGSPAPWTQPTWPSIYMYRSGIASVPG